MESHWVKQMLITALLLLCAFASPASVRAEDPWQYLSGFDLIADSPARIEEHYVAALFVNQKTRQIAVVVFNANCDSGNCEVKRRAAYSVFDAEGTNVRRYVDPGEQELL
ncbi:MAG TPA: hypothetical protein VGL11_15120, partial [Candidatus Binatia bacterium]